MSLLREVRAFVSGRHLSVVSSHCLLLQNQTAPGKEYSFFSTVSFRFVVTHSECLAVILCFEVRSGVIVWSGSVSTLRSADICAGPAFMMRYLAFLILTLAFIFFRSFCMLDDSIVVLRGG